MSFVTPDHVSVALSPVFTSKGLCAFMRATPVHTTADDATPTTMTDLLTAQPHLAGRLTDLFVEQLLQSRPANSLPMAVRLPHVGDADSWTGLLARLAETEAPFVLEIDGTTLLADPVAAASLVARAREHGLSVYAVADSTADLHAYALIGVAGVVTGDLLFTARPMVM
jgi:hypothetical protein